MEPLKIDITILQPLQKVWDLMIDPKHIMKWNFADPSWHCPKAENDFKVGGKLKTRMEIKNRSFGYDIVGFYDEIIPLEKIKYHFEDGRNVEIQFNKIDENTTQVVQIFEPEQKNSRQMQRDGWYAILNNFHKYVENY